MPARFALGRVVATPGALAALEKANTNALPLLARHAAGDWGDVDAQDKAANDAAIVSGARLLSTYAVGDAVCIWVITEAADERGWRASTCVLLPDEY